jgi:phosphatidylinositol kinase/protein kinase (PI-3  family)
MLLPAGNLFHIDFGYIFGRDPKPMAPPFRFTREMADGMLHVLYDLHAVFWFVLCCTLQ